MAEAKKQRQRHGIPMPKQKPEDRVHNFNEVALVTAWNKPWQKLKDAYNVLSPNVYKAAPWN